MSHALSVHLILLIPLEGAVEVFEGDVVVLVEPLHHERLEPSVKLLLL